MFTIGCRHFGLRCYTKFAGTLLALLFETINQFLFKKGWGFKTITFLDSGKVSFSNPVRQYLYRHEDAVSGKKMKATTAAERVKEINPSAVRENRPRPNFSIYNLYNSSIVIEFSIIVH